MKQQDLQDMSAFFRKKYFDGIPEIDCKFKPLGKGMYGCFCLNENKSRELDKEDPDLAKEVRNSPEYRSTYYDLGGIGYQGGCTPAFTDPLMNPGRTIYINHNLRTNRQKTTAILLHELARYWAWYLGYEYRDGDAEFEQKIREMGLPSMCDRTFINGEWRDEYDYNQIERYLRMFDSEGLVTTKD